MPTASQVVLRFLVCFCLLPPTAWAIIGTPYQMQLGNPSGATADTNNHNHYLILRTVEALDYSDNRGEPVWASWDLTAADIGTNSRASFMIDTNLPANFTPIHPSDYDLSGFDRGHLCPSKDRTDFATNNDLVFLMSNIMPQAPINNSGVWLQFEDYCRSLVQAPNNNELLIICGPSGFSGARINTNGPVLIPDYVWKVVVVVPSGGGMATNRVTAANRVIALKIPNTDAASNSWPFYVTSAGQIQADTGLTFFSGLPLDVAATLRAKVDGQTDNAILAGWEVHGLINYGPSPFAATTNAANLSVVGLTRGPGVKTSGTAAAGGWGGVAFTNVSAAAAVAVGQYVTFAVTANTGYTVSFSSLSRFDYYRSPSGPTDGVLQFQVGSGNFNDITNLSYPTVSAGDSIGFIDLSGFPCLQNIAANRMVTFRIVNYGGTSSSGTWYIYDTFGPTVLDLAVQGNVNRVIAPSLSILPLMNNQFRITVTGTTGANYVLQAATNLATSLWVPVVTNPAPFTFTGTSTSSFVQQFFRAAASP